ncbi:MAG TPA: FG-GAP-like repeat-containing protein [Xanthobacteraceae bacterium]|nr:FG-GAP-like repeat-containing protein [Xanthobacteraceae bacterium]
MPTNLVLFRGTGAGGEAGLWVTDGTSAGTWEISVPGASFALGGPSSLTPFGSEVFFEGADGLWVTDGTSLGTSEISVVGADPTGLQPAALTVFGSEMLFAGKDANGHDGLWVTNGTAAGTSELAVVGASATGVMPATSPVMVVYGSEVLFTGVDAAGNYGLWVTNGTSSGTSEISIAGAASGGIFAYGLDPIPSFAVLGSKVIFEGAGQFSGSNLWVTDGTSAGTSELTGTGLEGSSTEPSDLTTYGSEVLFDGGAVVNVPFPLFTTGLWVTDGTSTGTSEISVAGLMEVSDLTVFGSEALFEGERTNLERGLWITDGTSNGTSEITVAGANSGGIFNSAFSPSFVVFGSEVLFDGTDASGNDELWVTDGTSAGTSEISVVGAGSAFPPGLNPTDLVAFTQNLTHPVLSNLPATASFTELSEPITLAPSLRPVDSNSTILASATVSIAGGSFINDEDVLAATTSDTNITASYNSSSETLTLTGVDTLANYQQVLQSITFDTSSRNPTNFGSDPTRLINWVVNDGGSSNNLSIPQTTTVSVTIVGGPPTLTGLSTASFTEEGPAVSLSPAATVTDPENDALFGATVTIVGAGFFGARDVLAANTTGTNITTSYDGSTETLTLSGGDTLAHYQQVLDAVTFTSGENPTDYGSDPTRTIVWVLNDGGESNNLSTPQTTTVAITNVNDPPTLSDIAATLHLVGEHPVTVSPVLLVTDPDSLDLFNATVAITGGTFAGDGDVLAANTAGTSITASYNSATETLTLSGSDTLADYQAVLRSVTFSPGPDETDLGSNPTRTLTWVLNDGNASNNLSTPTTTTISITPQVRNDFTGDGMSDVLLQNTDGTTQIWFMNGTSITSMASLGNPGSAWHVAATGDFNGDGKADIVWQNTDGLTGIWDMNGASIIGTGLLGNPGAAWHVIATGDFMGNGNADILWQNTDGEAAIWDMNGTSIIGAAVYNPGSSWHAIGTGDFNGDGKSDILWQNTDGETAIWEMNGTSIIAAGVLGNPGASWHAIATGDFTGDGKSDILWQNTDGLTAIWEMNGMSIIAAGVLGNPGASWHAIGTSDFNGDGKADILWQNTDGMPAIWEMNGMSVIGAGVLPNLGANWHVKDDGPIAADQTGPASPNGGLYLSAPDLVASALASASGAPAAPTGAGSLLPLIGQPIFRT